MARDDWDLDFKIWEKFKPSISVWIEEFEAEKVESLSWQESQKCQNHEINLQNSQKRTSLMLPALFTKHASFFVEKYFKSCWRTFNSIPNFERTIFTIFASFYEKFMFCINSKAFFTISTWIARKEAKTNSNHR